MAEKIQAPDIDGPIEQLCWKQSRLMVRCDRRKGHQGPHSWDHALAGTADPVASPTPKILKAVIEQAEVWRECGDNYTCIQYEHAAASLEAIARRFGAVVNIFGKVSEDSPVSGAHSTPLAIEELAEVAKRFTIKSCDRWKGPAGHMELSCEQVQGLRLRDYCWSCLIPKLITAAASPVSEAPPIPPFCKDDAHNFGPCKTCGMPYLASRLETPTAEDIAWAASKVACGPHDMVGCKLCWPSNAVAPVSEAHSTPDRFEYLKGVAEDLAPVSEAGEAPTGHVYEEDGTSDCANGCGCWMGPTRSGGPDGIDPFGVCPKAPRSKETANQPHVEDDAAPRASQTRRTDEGSRGQMGTKLVSESEAGEATPPPQWQPIESAPKDGTYILLGNANCRVGFDRYIGAFRMPLATDEPSTAAGAQWRDYSGRFSTPTHWMPLPAAPVASPAKQEN